MSNNIRMAMGLVFFFSFVVSADEANGRKLVVLGFDGADAPLVESMMAAGELPHLAKLKELGDYRQLKPTNPPQTPVSWSTFATGLNPGRTQILDFIKRKENSYLPTYALQGESRKTVLFGKRNPWIVPPVVALVLLLVLVVPAFRWGGWWIRNGAIVLTLAASGGAFFVFSHWIPADLPTAVTVRQGKPIWTMMEEAGKTAAVIRLPVTFPSEPLPGEMISGLPVPDIRGTVGKPSLYTTDVEKWDKANKFSVQIQPLRGSSPFASELLGPPNKLFYDHHEADRHAREGTTYEVPSDLHVPLQVVQQGEIVSVVLQDHRLDLKLKEWSPWVTVSYRFNPLVTIKGFVRFYLHALTPHLELYATPVNLHPDNPLPLSYPADLAKTVWAEEPYKTLGWAIDTWSIGSDLMDEQQFLADLYLTVDRYEKLLMRFLDQSDRDLFIQVFSYTDRISHVLWRFMDPEHPRYEADKAEMYVEAIHAAYRRMDDIVGKAMEKIDFSTTDLMVCSDHGFASFRYQFNLNTFLVKNGYMNLKSNVLGMPMELDDLTSGKSPFDSVDWERTQAYGLGLGMGFLNIVGREPQGAVTPEQAKAVGASLAAALKSYVDPHTGMHPIREVYLRDDIYSGYDEKITPDFRIATAPPYRISWDTTLGGMPAEITDINDRTWSGDHCSLAPEDVMGILFTSRPIAAQTVEMADMCPSMLSVLGVTTTETLDGKSIFAP